ncbi:MAG: Abi family protein [Micropepsaceae bacterium]
MNKYFAATGNDLDQALALYERNTRLSEAFYTPLQCMEVCFRNKLNERLSNVHGSDWFQNGRPPFAQDAVKSLQEKIADLRQSKKVITVGSIVAEMSFGFWVGLLGPRYDATLWRQTLHAAFREQGAPMRRDRVHRRFNALRRFRNRIAHHEPIFLVNLAGMHGEIIEATSWMCSTTAAWALHQSRLPSVLAAI